MLYEPYQITDELRGKPLWGFNYTYGAAPILGKIRGDHFYYDGVFGNCALVCNRIFADTEKEAIAAYNQQIRTQIIKLQGDLARAEQDLLPED